MTSKKDLEDTIRDKVAPLLEETMEKNLGVNIPKFEHDISDKLLNPLSNVYIPFNLSFQKAKKTFRKEFLKKELKLHLGNISSLAKSLDIDRRSIHRAIKEFDINIKTENKETQQEFINETIKDTLNEYKDIIKQEKIEKIYQEVPKLSRNIAKLLPHRDFTWKEAEKEFEKQFFEHVLKKNQWNITNAAKKIEIRVETLHRKIKTLGLKRG